MAKALFPQMQRVYVKPVGTWACIEQVIPHWVKDVDEPLRITYECGLGRPFQGHELISEEAMRDAGVRGEDEDDLLLERWHIGRRTVKWRSAASERSADSPGTYPVILTNDGYEGGWRISPSDFDRDPQRAEHQARIIVQAPDLLRLARRIAEFSAEQPDKVPEELRPAARACAAILRYIYQLNDEPEPVAIAKSA